MMGEWTRSRPKIAVIDDHRLFSTGFALVLGAEPIGAEVAVFETPAALFAAHATGAPLAWDIVALDMFIPGFDPCETIRETRRRWPDSAVIVVSGSLSPGDEAACLAEGAAAFISKSIDPEGLRNRIEGLLLGDSATPVATHPSHGGETADALGLSPRQLEIILHVAHGRSNKEIAAAIGVSPETVKSHLATIFQKLGARNRMEAIDAVRGKGLA